MHSRLSPHSLSLGEGKLNGYILGNCNYIIVIELTEQDTEDSFAWRLPIKFWNRQLL